MLDKLTTIGTRYYIDYRLQPASAPPGAINVPYIPVEIGERIPAETLRTAAASAPGSVWYIGGEPNRRDITGAQYAEEFDYYRSAIKAGDPTARIMSASILNWDFTCTACGGFQSGESWMREFIDAYQATHSGELPAVDIWAIDTYPLRWDQVPMTDWAILTKQLEGLREFLDHELFRPGDPIWITEVASHWAYDAWTFGPDGTITLPPGLDWVDDYRWDQMTLYVANLARWLRDNSARLNIGKWFFFRDYIDVQTRAGADSAYAGLYFFESDDPGAGLNAAGEIYRDFAFGLR